MTEGVQEGRTECVGLPFDCEARDSRLLSQHVPSHSLDDRFGGRLGSQLVGVVLVVDVVSHANKLPPIVAAGQEYDCDAEDFGRRDAFQVRGVGFEDEFVDADGDGADKEGVEFLVVFGAGGDG